MKRIAVVLLCCARPPPPLVGPGSDAGADDGGVTDDAGVVDADAGVAVDDAGVVDAGPSVWQWLPIAGSKCGSGSTAGFALNAGSPDELFIFLQGGGACWNQGTCVPSLLSYGPVCYYNPNLCVADVPGGTQPTASHVTARDPYPADGGGALPSDLATLDRVKALDRAAGDNPFRGASWVYVPYCTGDLHSGATEKTYQYKYGAFDNPSPYVMHFAGATNMNAYLARLVALYPNVRRIWLTGASAGGYGATFNFDRVSRAFPNADVELLADSAPFVDTPHFVEWRDAWSMQFPIGCTGCADGGLPAVVEHLSTAYANRRIGLLSYDQDKVIAYYFFGGQGPGEALNPPVATFNAALTALETRYDAHPNTKYFVVAGDAHVLWGEYGSRLADGGYTAPRASRDGGTDEKRFIDAWADGGAAFQSTR